MGTLRICKVRAAPAASITAALIVFGKSDTVDIVGDSRIRSALQKDRIAPSHTGRTPYKRMMVRTLRRGYDCPTVRATHSLRLTRVTAPQLRQPTYSANCMKTPKDSSPAGARSTICARRRATWRRRACSKPGSMKPSAEGGFYLFNPSVQSVWQDKGGAAAGSTDHRGA